jgi:CheY-like chemotaxis protein
MAAADAHEGSAVSVLVADDNTDTAESMAQLLAMEGYVVHTAYDGTQALYVANEVRPQVALLDIGMPELTGYGVAAALRQQPWGEDMLLVAVTGYGHEKDRWLSDQAGFDHHLTKPVEPETLFALIGDWARRRSRAEGLAEQ